MTFKNYSLLEALILEEILGTKATYEMSHKLGFKFDKFKRWFNGDKILEMMHLMSKRQCSYKRLTLLLHVTV